MNPAFMAERNYISFPMLGNTTVALKSNVGVDDLIYKTKDGSPYKLTTFMSSDVNARSFLNRIKSNNLTESYVNTNIFSIGIFGKKGFNTIEFNLRGNANINAPYELFDFMKSGMKAENGTIYRIKDLKSSALNYAEFSYGHARKLNNSVSVGTKLKLLLGIGYSDASVDNLTAVMSQNKWAITMNGRINASMKNAFFKNKQEELTQQQIEKNKKKPGTYTARDNQFDGFELGSPSLGGFGLATDLGISCNINEQLTFSASLLDLGFIVWNNNLQASNNGNEGFLFNGFTNLDISDDGSGKSVDDQVNDLSNQLEEMVKFYDDGDKGKRTTSLATTMNLGLEYRICKEVSAGLLSSTHFEKIFTWTEARLSLNISPTKWIDFSASIAQSTFGTEAGSVINFHPKGLNIFVGTNRIFAKTTKEFIPMNGNADITFGINFTFGKRQAKATPAVEILPPRETPAPAETPPSAETENNISE